MYDCTVYCVCIHCTLYNVILKIHCTCRVTVGVGVILVGDPVVEWSSSLCTVYIYVDTSAYVRVGMNVWLPVYKGLQFDEEFVFKSV